MSINAHDEHTLIILREILLSDNDSMVRAKAAEAIQKFGVKDPLTIKAVRQALNDECVLLR